MTDSNIYHDIAVRTGGACMLGVVGPVRTGKSTFIKRFMETLVIPQIENPYMRERARDELPQSGSGRTIMTAEPKFVPEEAVGIRLGSDAEVSVRLVDCVGYMVNGASGQYEEEQERLVTTPWFDHEVSLSEAAEKGTHKVIAEHSTIGIVVTTDGTICDIERENYREPEERAIRELKSIGKPFVVLLNCLDPEAESAVRIAEEISRRYDVECLRVNCQTLTEADIRQILYSVLQEFPLGSIGVYLPEWLSALADNTPLKKEIYGQLRQACENTGKLKDARLAVERLAEFEKISQARTLASDLGDGSYTIEVQLPRALYYETLSEETGLDIRNDADLISTLTEMSRVKSDYDGLAEALRDVRQTGYGVVMPVAEHMTLEEPQIVRQGGKYTVKLKANAPVLHMFMTNVETEVTPAIGGETASEDIINFLLQGFDGDVNRIWESNIFGKSLNDIAEEGLNAKIQAMPEKARKKLQLTLQRIINEGSGGLICILL